MGPARFLKVMLDASRGGRHLESGFVSYHKFTRASVTSPDRAHVQVDGEYLGELPVEVVSLPRALTVLVPPFAPGRAPAPGSGPSPSTP
jgi:diacylglycerol kinase family enzyme